jgi:predicted house-cleaning noncanonical NTP pyrophosphatase (MazG superfamily)
VFQLLKENCISSQVYTLSWWYTLYSSSLGLKKVLAIWDILLIFGDMAVIKFAVFLINDLEDKMREEFYENGFVDIRSMVELADIGRVIRKVVESSDISGKLSGKIGYALSGSLGQKLGLKGNNIDFGDLNEWVLGEILSTEAEKKTQGGSPDQPPPI